MTIRQRLVVALMGVSIAAIAPYAPAQTNSTSNSNNNSASQAAGKAVAKARADANRAQAEVGKIRSRVRAAILLKPEWAAVVSGRKQAQEALDTAKKAVLSSVHSRDEYKKLYAEREAARAVMTPADGAPAADADVKKASDVFITDSFAMKQMESAALKDDPKFDEATKQFEAADAKLKDLDSQVDLAMKDDREYIAADKAVQTANTALASATAQLKQARQADETRREGDAKSRAQN